MTAYAVGLRLNMQSYLYQYWTVAEKPKKGISAPLPCVGLIIIFLFYRIDFHTIRRRKYLGYNSEIQNYCYISH